jgi:Cysteine-rich secretory protein family
VGENIGWGQASLATARSMVTAWMNSPGHRENLLSADYTQVGLGLALGTPTDQTWGATYTTDFGAGAAPAPAHASAKAAAATRKKARRAASCARAASTRRGARTTKARRASACGRSARVRRR